ncbi:Retrotransposon Gag-Pol polyprotein [Diutina catenulata]
MSRPSERDNVSNPTVSRAPQGPDSNHGDNNDAEFSASDAPNGSESVAPDPLNPVSATGQTDTLTAMLANLMQRFESSEKRYQEQIAQQNAMIQSLVSRIMDSSPSAPASVPASSTPVFQDHPAPPADPGVSDSTAQSVPPDNVRGGHAAATGPGTFVFNRPNTSTGKYHHGWTNERMGSYDPGSPPCDDLDKGRGGSNGNVSGFSSNQGNTTFNKDDPVEQIQKFLKQDFKSEMTKKEVQSYFISNERRLRTAQQIGEGHTFMKLLVNKFRPMITPFPEVDHERLEDTFHRLEQHVIYNVTVKKWEKKLDNVSFSARLFQNSTTFNTFVKNIVEFLQDAPNDLEYNEIATVLYHVFEGAKGGKYEEFYSFISNAATELTKHQPSATVPSDGQYLNSDIAKNALSRLRDDMPAHLDQMFRDATYNNALYQHARDYNLQFNVPANTRSDTYNGINSGQQYVQLGPRIQNHGILTAAYSTLATDPYQQNSNIMATYQPRSDGNNSSRPRFQGGNNKQWSSSKPVNKNGKALTRRVTYEDPDTHTIVMEEELPYDDEQETRCLTSCHSTFNILSIIRKLVHMLVDSGSQITAVYTPNVLKRIVDVGGVDVRGANDGAIPVKKEGTLTMVDDKGKEVEFSKSIVLPNEVAEDIGLINKVRLYRKGYYQCGSGHFLEQYRHKDTGGSFWVFNTPEGDQIIPVNQSAQCSEYADQIKSFDPHWQEYSEGHAKANVFVPQPAWIRAIKKGSRKKKIVEWTADDLENPRIAQLRYLHDSLAHQGIPTLKAHLKARGITFTDEEYKLMRDSCFVCGAAKAIRPDYKELKKGTRPLERVYADTCHIPVPAARAPKVFTLITDSFSHYMFIGVSRGGSEGNQLKAGKAAAADFVRTFFAFVTTQSDRKYTPKEFVSDPGREFENDVVRDMCKKLGLRHLMSTVNQPQQNGVAERANRTVLQLTRTLLLQSKVPDKWWHYAAVHAVNVWNTTRPDLGESPWTCVTGKDADNRYSLPFGCLVLYYDNPVQGAKVGTDPSSINDYEPSDPLAGQPRAVMRGKLEPTGKYGVLLGVSHKHFGFIIGSLHKSRAVIHTRNVISFYVRVFPLALKETKPELFRAITGYNNTTEWQKELDDYTVDWGELIEPVPDYLETFTENWKNRNVPDFLNDAEVIRADDRRLWSAMVDGPSVFYPEFTPRSALQEPEPTIEHGEPPLTPARDIEDATDSTVGPIVPAPVTLTGFTSTEVPSDEPDVELTTADRDMFDDTQPVPTTTDEAQVTDMTKPDSINADSAVPPSDEPMDPQEEAAEQEGEPMDQEGEERHQIPSNLRINMTGMPTDIDISRKRKTRSGISKEWRQETEHAKKMKRMERSKELRQAIEHAKTVKRIVRSIRRVRVNLASPSTEDDNSPLDKLTTNFVEQAVTREHGSWQDIPVEYFRPAGDSSSLAVRAIKKKPGITQKEADRIPGMQDAIQSELDAHAKRGTWGPEPIYDVSPHIKTRTIGTRWVYAMKNVLSDLGDYLGEKPKARLVARGDHQDPTTYSETYAPTLMMEVLRLIIASSVSQGWQLHQIDIDTAYLNASFSDDEEIYITVPRGLTHVYPKKNGVRPVFRLNKALYGTKQAGRRWYEKLFESIKSYGFRSSDACPSMYVKVIDDEVAVVLAVFVDDILICAKSDDLIKETVQQFQNEYAIKDLGYPTEILRTRITSNEDKTEVYMDREKSIEKLIEEFDIKPKIVDTPLPSNFSFDPETNPLNFDNHTITKRTTRMRQIVGSLLHLSITVRPDIAYAATMLARYVVYPHEKVMKAAERSIQYLNCTKYRKLKFKRDERSCESFYGFSDSGYSREQEVGDLTKYSSLGFIVFKDGPVHWKSARSKWVCDSIAQAEMTAAWSLTCTLTFLNKVNYFLRTGKDLDDHDQYPYTNFLCTDSKTVSQIIRKDHHSSSITAHWSNKFHTCRQLQRENLIETIHVDTIRNPADLLTKPVPHSVDIQFSPDEGITLTDCLFDFSLVKSFPSQTHRGLFEYKAEATHSKKN